MKKPLIMYFVFAGLAGLPLYALLLKLLDQYSFIFGKVIADNPLFIVLVWVVILIVMTILAHILRAMSDRPMKAKVGIYLAIILIPLLAMVVLNS